MGLDSDGWVAVATGASAVGTTIAAAVTAYMAAKTRDMANATQAAVGQAWREAREATRSRVDARAPNVSVALLPRDWPPYDEEPDANMGSRPALSPGHHFTMPRDKDRLLYFVSALRLRNDGLSTAEVRVSGSRHEDRVFGGVHNLVGPTGERGVYILGPQDEIKLNVVLTRTVGDMVTAWGDGRFVGQHRPEAKLLIYVNAQDHFADGMGDNTEVELISYALTPVADDGSAWVVREQRDNMTDVAPTVGGAVLRTRRTYIGEMKVAATLEAGQTG